MASESALSTNTAPSVWGVGIPHLWPLNWSQCIRQLQSITTEMASGSLTCASPTAGSWPPVSSHGPRLHRRAAEKTGATCQHPPTHQPARHNELYLTTADHQLLTRWNVMRLCEHTKNTRLFLAAMWPWNVFTLSTGTFLFRYHAGNMFF